MSSDEVQFLRDQGKTRIFLRTSLSCSKSGQVQFVIQGALLTLGISQADFETLQLLSFHIECQHNETSNFLHISLQKKQQLFTHFFTNQCLNFSNF